MACPHPDEDAVSTSSSSSMKRSPLTPIAVDGHRTTEDPKLAFSPSNPSFAGSHSDDELRQRPSLYQRRKLSVPGLSIGRPPYHRRRSHNRRSSPARNSPAVPASLTPIHPTFISERRTSLPALHFHETVRNAVPLHLNTRTPQHRDSNSEDMYGALHSYTFGAPPCHSHQPPDDDDDEDEDERQRRDRAKMRAIDDGTRRPSLPTNSSTPTALRSQPSFSSLSSAGIVVGERQWEEHSEPDWDIVMGDITPTKATPSPPPSSSGNISSQSEPRRPSVPIAIPVLRRRSRSADELAVDFDQRMRSSTPTQAALSTSTPLFSWVEHGQSHEDTRGSSSSPEEDPTLVGFNLQYIFNDDAASDTVDPQLRHQESSGLLRYRFRTKAKKAVQTRFEDTFMRHIMDSDPAHKQRQAEWTFRRESRPNHPAASVKGKDKERTVRLAEDYEGWRCEWVGRFNVYKIRSGSRPTAATSDASKGPYNRLQIMHCPDPENKGNRSGGPRVLVHRHSRAQAFSIFRAHSIHPKRAMIPTDSVLLAVKSVLREYTRTESTRALKTYGFTDDGDSRLPQSRSGPDANAGGSQERSRSQSSSSTRPRGITVHEPATMALNGSNVQRSSVSVSNRPATQSPEARPRRTSTRNPPQTNVSRPATASSAATSRPSSLALTESSQAPNFSSVSSSAEHFPPVHQWDPPSPRSPRLSTSHAEAFAMVDPDVRELDWHHRNDSGAVPSFSSTRVATPHAPSLPPPSTPSPPHTRSTLGFGERIKRAFGSSKPPPPPQKEPVSPVSDEGEDEPKTANQDGRFAPPWLTVARRSEKEQHDRMIRTLNDSFESVGLIPPQDKKKSNKSRPHHKGSKGAQSVLDDVPDDSMCMLLPLWPEETDLSTQSRSNGLSRQSSNSARHTATQSLGQASISTVVPLQERRFLLVYYVQFENISESDTDHGNGNNKKRRRPQTAGERPQYPNHLKASAAPGSFYAVGRLLTYDDVRSSGVRLPEKGVSVNGALAEAVMAAPSRFTDFEVMAIYDTKENGVLLDQDGLVKLGLMNSLDENAKLSEVGRAIVEMVWCGCISLMSFTP